MPQQRQSKKTSIATLRFSVCRYACSHLLIFLCRRHHRHCGHRHRHWNGHCGRHWNHCCRHHLSARIVRTRFGGLTAHGHSPSSHYSLSPCRRRHSAFRHFPSSRGLIYHHCQVLPARPGLNPACLYHHGRGRTPVTAHPWVLPCRTCQRFPDPCTIHPYDVQGYAATIPSRPRRAGSPARLRAISVYEGSRTRESCAA